MEEVKKFPAPWDLKGQGYIFLYKFKKDFVKENGNVPDFLKDNFKGGFGSIMLVNYESSNAGPYGELLFIPGKFNFKKKKLNTISKIYVSSMESVINGRNNWGIPKEKADFKFEQIDKKHEKAIVNLNDKIIFEGIFKTEKFSFPVNTKLLPFPLVQLYENKYFYTNFYGKGKGHFSKIKSLKIDNNFFPDVSNIKPIAIVKVNPFDITFPISEIED